MKVFLDTNVLVSAFATRGLSADVLRVVMAEHELVLGEVVLDELRRVLDRKFGVPQPTIAAAIDLLRRHHVEPRPAKPHPLGIKDPDDPWVVASAIHAGAEVFVTGDRELLEAADAVQGLRILNPREFWEEVSRNI